MFSQHVGDRTDSFELFNANNIIPLLCLGFAATIIPIPWPNKQLSTLPHNMLTQAVFVCLTAVAAAVEMATSDAVPGSSTSANLMDESGAAMAPRIEIKDIDNLWKFVQDGENISPWLRSITQM